MGKTEGGEDWKAENFLGEINEEATSKTEDLAESSLVSSQLRAPAYCNRAL